tara:strand:+ start:1004 stop:1966 length:963 start_codon:yes stop_codon:yes gene_type:complete
MFSRKPKKQNKILRSFLKLFNIYAIDRENFNFINPNLNNHGKNIYIFNDKLFNLSVGYTEITRKIYNLDIIYRYCPSNALWNSKDNWKRVIPNIDKGILIKTCLNSLKKSINIFLEEEKNVNITLHLVSDGSTPKFDNDIFKILENKNFKLKFYEPKIPGNHGSFLECCDIAEKLAEDLIFFIEDDYLFEENAISEILFSYSKISSQIKQDIFMCPSDYPFYYDSLYETSLILGKNNRWRFIGETLLTFLVSKKIFNQHLKKVRSIGELNNKPFEKPLHDIYKEVPCFSPIGTLAHHISRSVPSLNENWLELWKKNLHSD